MPQINFYTYLSQTTWTIILFFIFYYLMKQYILPSIREGIVLKKTNISSQTKSTSLSYTFNKYFSILKSI